MSVYDYNGLELLHVFDVDGNELTQCYDIHKNALIGKRKPIKVYSYSDDEDPEKSIVWNNYNLETLQRMQGNKFTIGIQTDTHYWQPDHSTDYITPLKNLTKQLYFDFITNMGDIPRGWGSDTETPAYTLAAENEAIRRYTDYVEAPVLIARGNHDNGMYHHGSGHPQTMDSTISKADLYECQIGAIKKTTTIVESGTGDFYYYKDFSECRVIVLDTNDYPFVAISDYDVHGNHHTISETQINWFTNVALNTDKPVLIISHCILTNAVDSRFLVPEEDKGYMDDNPRLPYRAEAILSALNTFKTNGGDVVACLAGHIHKQASAKVNGINHIAFANSGYFAEIAFIDFDNRKIAIKVVGNNTDSTLNTKTLVDRMFTF